MYARAVADERARELERKFAQGDEDAGWALVRERMRAEGMVVRLLSHVVRLEQILGEIVTVGGRQVLRGRAEVSASEVLDWIDRGPPPPAPPPPPVIPYEPPPPSVHRIEANRGYSQDWLLTGCSCMHARGHHRRPPEGGPSGVCMIPRCPCESFELPP